MKEPRGQELINRYRWNYNIPRTAEVTEEMILAHWDLETRLTRELLNSTPESRWDTFEKCYTTLYTKLEWLNRYIGANTATPPAQKYRDWAMLIGTPPRRIYEIGSGKGTMISYLASLGHYCRGTEITHERGRKHVIEHPNLTWGISDGIHFDRFEPINSYDVAVSDNVIEHIHPDDLVMHMIGVISILAKGGRYIMATPHVWYGPWDISKVFKRKRAEGMHLKEYTYSEIKHIANAAGFQNIAAIRQRKDQPATPSSVYLNYLCVLERVFALLPWRIAKHERVKGFAKSMGFSPMMFIIAHK